MVQNKLNRWVLTSAIATTLTTGVAHAYEKGDLILRAGPILVEQGKELQVDIQSPDLGIVYGAEVGGITTSSFIRRPPSADRRCGT